MFKWFKNKHRSKSKVLPSRMKPAVSNGKMRGTDADHIYEEIADQKSIELPTKRSKVKQFLHNRIVNIKRSISFHDVLGEGKKSQFWTKSPVNIDFSDNKINNNFPDNHLNLSTGNLNTLHFNDITFDCLPEKGKKITGIRRESSIRTVQTNPNIYLPRKSATFASADTDVAYKREKINLRSNRDQDADNNGSDSGYGFSNSVGSEASDGTYNGNVDAFVSKMRELLKLEKEVRDILENMRLSKLNVEYQNIANKNSSVQNNATYENLTSFRAASPPLIQNNVNAHRPLQRFTYDRTLPYKLNLNMSHSCLDIPSELSTRLDNSCDMCESKASDRTDLPTERNSSPVSDTYLTPVVSEKRSNGADNNIRNSCDVTKLCEKQRHKPFNKFNILQNNGKCKMSRTTDKTYINHDSRDLDVIADQGKYSNSFTGDLNGSNDNWAKLLHLHSRHPRSDKSALTPIRAICQDCTDHERRFPQHSVR